MKDDHTLGKIILLSGCIMAFLLFCFYDTYKRKGGDVFLRFSQSAGLLGKKQTAGSSGASREKGGQGESGQMAQSESPAFEQESEAAAAKPENDIADAENPASKQESEAAAVKPENDIADAENPASKQESEAAAVKPENDTADAENPLIRVLIKTDQFAGEYHGSVTLQCTTGYVVQYGETTEEHAAGEALTIAPDSPYFSENVIRLQPKEERGEFVFPNLVRNYDSPSYLGDFEIVKRDEGLLIINELPLETYLCSVVPSEMPASYPLEALKVQAVCARSYARKQMEGQRGAEFGADVDDSVSYQVYNNQPRDERASQAVSETAGHVMRSGGEIVDALYYSTSCGFDLNQDLSQETVFASFMSGDGQAAYEAGEPWFRWKATFPIDEITRLVNESQQTGVGGVTGLEVASRDASGAIDTLIVKGEDGTLEIKGEYSVRQLLSPVNVPVARQDGSEEKGMSLLPSAFFYLTPQYEGDVLTGYLINGGGYGHGKGMSQNGAKHMAEAGKSCGEILKYYYGDVQVE